MLFPSPDVYPLNDTYYVEDDDYLFIFYDKQMKVVSSYIFPDYAEMIGSGLLSEDKLVCQYKVLADQYGDKYDLLEDGKKYDLHTVIFDIKKGNAKEIQSDYIIEGVYALSDESRAYIGVSEKLKTFGYVYPIVDKRVDEAILYFASVSESGKVELFGQLNGLEVANIRFVNTNRWLVDTVDDTTYLVNEKFEIIGDVSNVSWSGFGQTYINADGKLYDYDLKEVFDYEKEELSVVKVFKTSVLFVDDSDIAQYYLFANGQKTKITSTEEITEGGVTETVGVKIYAGAVGDDCFAIRDYSNEEEALYKLYNSENKLLADFVIGQNFGVSVKLSAEGQMLIAVSGYDTVNEENTVTYYVIK